MAVAVVLCMYRIVMFNLIIVLVDEEPGSNKVVAC